ncbi:MAG: hypothetical protein PHG66_02395 [Candidatus Colwellbacteria bacterium]|nr:hypothetical protein [Candidatus Colwellbacteria bacterium]
MSIMFIIMGTVANSGADRRMQFNISINQEKLRALISRAKSLSMNSLFQAGSQDCGYGVHLDQNRAIIFIDRGPVCDHRFNGGEQVLGSSNEVIPKEGIYFADMTSGAAVPGTFGGDGTADIVFLPPDPTTYVNADSNRDITLGVIASTASMDQVKVIVERSGLITTRSR